MVHRAVLTFTLLLVVRESVQSPPSWDVIDYNCTNPMLEVSSNVLDPVDLSDLPKVVYPTDHYNASVMCGNLINKVAHLHGHI